MAALPTVQNYATPPNLGVTPGAAAGTGSLTQGTALPNITTTQEQATATPQFYTDYLNQLASNGATAAQGAQYVGAMPLQEQAFTNVANNVGNYQPALNQAQNQINTAAAINPSAAAAGTINTAMNQNAVGAANPYLQSAANASPLAAASQNINAATGLSGANAASPYLNAGANTNVLGAAQPYLNAAAVPTSQTVNQYMSPYTQDVVNAIGNLGQANIAQNLSPQATAGLVGAGNFGSTRGQQALGEVLANAGLGITGQQASALQSGYQNALTAAQNQASLYGQLGSTAGTLAQNQAANLLNAGSTYGSLTNQQAANLINAAQLQGNLTQNQAANQLAAGQTAGNLTNSQMANQLNAAQLQGTLAGQTQQGALNAATAAQNLGTTTQNLGLGDVNALSTLGAQQQTIAQNQQLFPMAQLTAESNLLKGATIPTSTSSSYTGPIPGAYNTSPLAQIAGVGSVLAGTGLGQTLFGSPATGSQAATSGLLGSSLSSAGNWLSNLGSQTSPTTNPAGVPEGAAYNGNGTYTYTDPSTGVQTTYDSSGNVVANDAGQAAVSTYDPFAQTSVNPVDSSGVPIDYMNYTSGS
jgi:hypothetical protein